METSIFIASSASLHCSSMVPVNIMKSFWSLISSNMIMSGQVSEALQFGCKRVKSLPYKMLRSCTASNNNCPELSPGACTSDCKTPPFQLPSLRRFPPSPAVAQLRDRERGNFLKMAFSQRCRKANVKSHRTGWKWLLLWEQNPSIRDRQSEADNGKSRGESTNLQGIHRTPGLLVPSQHAVYLPTLSWSSFSHLQDGAENATLGICASNAPKGSISTGESSQDLVGSLFNLSQRGRVLACPVCPTMVEGMWRVRIDSLFLATYWPKSQCRLLAMSHTLPSLPRWEASVPH